MLSHTTTACVCVCQCVCVCECVFKFQCIGNMLSFSPFCNPFFTYSKWEAEKTEYIHPCKTVKLPMVPSSLHTACVSQCVCVCACINLVVETQFRVGVRVREESVWGLWWSQLCCFICWASSHNNLYHPLYRSRTHACSGNSMPPP